MLNNPLLILKRRESFGTLSYEQNAFKEVSGSGKMAQQKMFAAKPVNLSLISRAPKLERKS